MLSLINTHTHIPNSHLAFSLLNTHLVPSLIIEYNPKRRAKSYKRAAVLCRYFGFTQVRKAWKFQRDFENSWCCRCKQSEGDIELETEIMGFMEKSEKPTMFPTKKELIHAGRIDLVEAIKKRGGWYSLGWEEEEEDARDNVEETMGLDIGEFQRRVEGCKETASLRKHFDDSFSRGDTYLNYGNQDSVQLADSASLDRSLEIGVDEDSGIEGILSRLEKERNNNFGINLEKNRYETHTKSKDEGHDRHFSTSLGIARNDLGENGRFAQDFHQKDILNTSGGNISPIVEPETWRTWSNQRAGFQHTEFEAAKISFSKNQVKTDKEIYHDGIAVTTEEYAESWDKHEEFNPNQIRTRLRHLECELTSALNSLRSKRKECISEEAIGSSSDLQKLSDAWEFQENDFTSAQERLRSLRAKLAVIEGKMALAIINAQKIVEVKQQRIDVARNALLLLRTIFIVWPNSGSEVLLAGSFDGWTTQRRMENSGRGIFSLYLKLYPGRYEIKFIVDGEWKIDRLRPIVYNNGHENNLLIIT